MTTNPNAPDAHGAPPKKPKGNPMLATLSDLIATHAPSWAQGDTGIAILCLATIATGYLWAYAKRKGAL
jgi:hypothetical protein